jgi:hypothetical protein
MMPNIARLFTLPTNMFVDLIKHKHGIGLFKQAIATWMFQSHVTNVSKQSYTYISRDDECNMMLILMI